MGTTKNYKHNYRESILVKSNHRCFYCSKILTVKSMTIDHLTPLSKGGSNFKDNKVAACRFCNNKKGNLTLMEYYEIHGDSMDNVTLLNKQISNLEIEFIKFKNVVLETTCHQSINITKCSELINKSYWMHFCEQCPKYEYLRKDKL